MKKWHQFGLVLASDEVEQLRSAAKEKGLSVNSIIYAILHRETNGFTDFTTIPSLDQMPRGVFVRRKSA
jgi:hypothetical protein